MRFRPCIDIHNGKVKQIVGGSLKDQGDQAAENFVAEQDAAWYASLYKEKKLSGGHVILLNPASLPLLRDNQGPGHESPRCLARRSSDRRRHPR